MPDLHWQVTQPYGLQTTNTWDYENHLTVIEQPAVNNITYSYNPDGLRVEKNDKGTITKFVWDDQAYLLETDTSDVTTVVYSNEPSVFGKLISQRRSSNTNFFHFDALGSTKDLTASDESITDTLIYSAWGEEIDRTGATDVDFQFVGSQGYYRDSESDLFYIRARYLNPGLAIWRSKDPVPAFFSDSLNNYLFVLNNPVLRIDPSGKLSGVGCGGSINRLGCDPMNTSEWKPETGGPYKITRYICKKEPFTDKGNKCTQDVTVDVTARRFGPGATDVEDPRCFYTKILFVFSLTNRICRGCRIVYTLPDIVPKRERVDNRIVITGGIQKSCCVGPPRDDYGVFVNGENSVQSVSRRFKPDPCYGESEGDDLVNEFCGMVMSHVNHQNPPGGNDY